MERASLGAVGARLALVGAVLVLAACRDVPGPQPPKPGLTASWPGVISDPVSGGSPVSSGGALSHGATSGTDIVYISLAPGTIPGGEVASIRNRATGSGVVAAMVAGGLDPVPVEATTGDTLDIDVRLAAGDSTPHFEHVVAAALRPIVVRTDPPPRKRDVPLNASMLIVFSEPIDPATLTDASVQLLQGATLVLGRLEFRDPANLTAAFVPTAQLAPSADYRLDITQGIRDLDGESLEAPVTVEFTTEPVGGAATQLVFTIQPANTFAGWTIRPAVQVTVRDAAGNAATTFTGAVTVAIGTNPGGASLSGRSTVAAVAGVASFGDLRISTSGVGYALTAVATELTEATSSAFDVLAVGPGRIAFHRDVAGTTGSGLFVMNADGTGLTRLTDGGGQFPTWSPDGTRLAFNGNPSVINADGSGRVDMGGGPFGMYPAWSPDGTRIAFMMVEDSGPPWPLASGVYVMNADGSDLTRLTHGVLGRIAWSPGAKIAFPRRVCCVEGGWSIHVMNADGSGVTPLTNEDPLFGDGEPAWSPDGSRIAFVRRTWDPTLRVLVPPTSFGVMNADGSGVETLLTVEVGNADWPTWSPDGQRIAFVKSFHGEAAPQGNAIYVMNADGSGVTRLTFDDAGNWQPAWSPAPQSAAGARSQRRP